MEANSKSSLPLKTLLKRKLWLALVALAGLVLLGTRLIVPSKIDFNTDVKPIFNKKCITCHGGVRRKSGFSLLFRSEALAPNESGKPAIVPGDPDHSEMIRRLTLKDPEERMPYKHEPLSESEIKILRNWIKQGAQWGDHWAYVPLQPTPVPKPKSRLLGLLPATDNGWAKNDIDYFILDKLKEIDLQPSPEADKATLLRRVSFDLTGMPASEAVQQRFLTDTGTLAYERLVDTLLASPRYGERWAALWLDLARYADTKGYERDDQRSIWRYRDWLIKAFNSNMPYDQFLTEQLAGDLLPHPTDDQLIATAFHRNTMTNDEGGTDNEEFRTAAVLDRVNTTWEVVEGTTFACVQCHSHPYDPFTHDEYYKFMAFFNNTRDQDTYADYPLLHEYKGNDTAKLADLDEWLKTNATADRREELIRFIKTWQPAINSLSVDSFSHAALADTKWLALRNHGSCRLKAVALDNKSWLMFRYSAGVNNGTWSIHLDSMNGSVIANVPIGKTKNGWGFGTAALQPATGVHDLYFTYNNPSLKKPDDNGVTFDWFYFTQPFPGNGNNGYDSAYKHFWDLVKTGNVEITPIMMENPADLFRPTHVFERGNWMVKGKKVDADVPHSLNPLPDNAPHNRLGLAAWVTSKQNPLTARTMVNRVWEQFFGEGIVETLEDMGTQGTPPTHPELLNWLSWKFMTDDHWNLKSLMREIVMSATYRQDSKLNPASQQKDPSNKYYSRGPRVRLSAEQLRDQALAVSGLMQDKMYGKSVMPYQPQNIWLSPYDDRKWERSTGEDQYRRAVYTYWKRTAPYPSMISFDGAAREVCVARRIRTNTPLQALTTLNDSVYLETARFLAFRMQKAGTQPEAQISRGYEWAMMKSITPEKQEALMKLYNRALQKFNNNQAATCEMVGIDDEHNNPKTAALVVVANAIMNLDEFVTKN